MMSPVEEVFTFTKEKVATTQCKITQLVKLNSCIKKSEIKVKRKMLSAKCEKLFSAGIHYNDG